MHDSKPYDSRRLSLATLTLTLLAALALTLTPASAQAIPIYFDGPSGFGTSDSAAASAFAGGVAELEADLIEVPADFGISIPAPTGIELFLEGSPSRISPSRATSTWTVTNGGTSLADAWLVFLTPVADPPTATQYAPADTGIDLVPGGEWGVLEISAPFMGVLEDFHYPAVRLGDLAAGASAQFVMRHAIPGPLQMSGADMVLPRYAVGVLIEPTVALPEPSSVALLVLGAGVLLLRRKSLR